MTCIERKSVLSPQDNTLTFQVVENLSQIDPSLVQKAVQVYQNAFAQPPYYEMFTEETSRQAFAYILEKKGDLIFGIQKNQVLSIAGGFVTGAGAYFIEELAVDPTYQRHGFGRQTLLQLIECSKKHQSSTWSLRTTNENIKSLGLYKSIGFKEFGALEVVPSIRTNGEVKLDERVYLMKTEEEAVQQMDIQRFVVAYPGGNPTGIVFDQYLSLDRNEFQKKVDQAWQTHGANSVSGAIEQYCFVTKPKNPKAMARVEMFGGEFCGNATRSVISLLTKGMVPEGLIEVSGVDRPLRFWGENGQVILEMPIPQSGEGALTESVEEGTLVFLDGITHLVVTKTTEKTAEEIFAYMQKQDKYGCISKYPAFGVSLFDQEANKARFCVFVKAMGSVFDESACGSGTCSIGVAIAQEKKVSQDLHIMQPSGHSIRICVDVSEEKISQARISGDVRVDFDGKLVLN